MKFIDSHCHLHDPEFFAPADAEAALQRSIKAGVDRMVVIGTTVNDSFAAVKFATDHPENVFATIGIHPHGDGYDDIAKQQLGSSTQLNQIPSDNVVAVGEIGLDYHYEGYDRDSQIKLFEEMLQFARNAKLPVVLHVREAFHDIWPILDNFPELTGVFHSFTDTEDSILEALRRGYYIGVNGIVTFAKGIPLPPLDRMLLETDAPFLAPPPHRGKTNEPAFIPDIARFLTKKLGKPLPEIAKKTTANTELLFKLSK